MENQPHKKPSVWTNPKTVLLLAAFLIAAASQFALLQKNLALGLGGYALATILFAVTISKTIPPHKLLTYPMKQGITRQPVIAIIGLAGAVVLFFAAQTPPQSAQSNQFLVVGWVLSILLFSTGILIHSGWHFPSVKELTNQIRAHRVEMIAVCLLVLIAFVLRTVHLETHPYGYENDESWIGIEALRILNGTTKQFFTVSWSAQPILSFLPTTIPILLFGNTVFAVRITSVIEGTLTVLFLYLGTREIFNWKTALLAAGILATLPVHNHFSRTGFNNIVPGFYGALLFWLVFRALRRGRPSSFLWAGLVAGSAIYTYLGSRLAIAIFGFALVYTTLFERGYFKKYVSNLLVFGFAAFVVMAPMLGYFLNHYDLFMARMNTEGILSNGWLANEALRTSQTQLGALWLQIQKSVLAFISTGAPRSFYNSPKPYFPVLTAIFLVLGMGYSFIRIKEPVFMTLLVWFWSTLLFGSILTTNAPASQRIILLLPAAALFAAIGLEQTARALAKLRLLPFHWGMTICFLIVLISGYQNVHFYLDEYRANNYHGDHSNELIYESVRLERQLGTSYEYVLLGAPMTRLDFASFTYLLDGYNKQELITSDPQAIAQLSPNQRAFFVAIPDRKEELTAISRQIPGGQWIEFPRYYSRDQVLFYGYVFPPQPELQVENSLLQPNLILQQLFSNPMVWVGILLLMAMLVDVLVLPRLAKDKQSEKQSEKPAFRINRFLAVLFKEDAFDAPVEIPLEMEVRPDNDLHLSRESENQISTEDFQPLPSSIFPKQGDLPDRCGKPAIPKQPGQFIHVDLSVRIPKGSAVQIDIHTGQMNAQEPKISIQPKKSKNKKY